MAFILYRSWSTYYYNSGSQSHYSSVEPVSSAPLLTKQSIGADHEPFPTVVINVPPNINGNVIL